jgi:hypothetical protein
MTNPLKAAVREAMNEWLGDPLSETGIDQIASALARRGVVVATEKNTMNCTYAPPAMRIDTVYFNGPHAPKDKTFISGFTEINPKTQTIAVSLRDDWRGGIFEFPMHVVVRIERNTGWR